jgi:hypothetical protein
LTFIEAIFYNFDGGIMINDEKDKKFKVIDKRFKERDKDEQQVKQDEELGMLERLSLKERFIILITSLMQSGLVYLGEIADPITNQKNINLNEVRNTISMIEMLKEKSRNNIDKEEQDYIEGVLYTLKMKYIDKMKVR